ncbi:UbiA family prenyltransferase [Pelagibacterium montanilacus]|uniref:UbiA family prenyltransferase n=1 Tax=Pelagibacterium montanilacus TaxID=2185280 RepID=UPI000F8CD243|nr:UbiA family prenyltransferase [Pelagibacterium montanilacus]
MSQILAQTDTLDASEADASLLPLVLDLDRTLVRSDLLEEMALLHLRGHPLALFDLVGWTLEGRAQLKRRLAEAVALDVEHLPVNAELIAYAEAEAGRGRQIVLATAADTLIASKVAKRFAFIDRVIASDGETNLKGPEKARVLAEMFPDGFVYAGDSHADLAVWKKAAGSVIVGASPALERAARAASPMEKVFARPPSLGAWAKAARLHQWAKNLLVFVPLVLSGHMLDPVAWWSAGLAFLALGVLASSTYMINDLWDIADDRRHWTKRNRPIASGRLRLGHTVMAVPIGLAMAFGLGALAGGAVMLVLAAYLGLTLSYSLALKRKPVLDAFVLAVLFTLRLVLGIAAVGVVASPWLLVFSMFLFASLSFAKRQTEVQRMAETGRDIGEKIAGRGYFAMDAPFILAMGVSSGMASILIMVLYLTQDALMADFYGNSVWLWAIPALLFLWLSRIWMICQRGELNDDPVAFAIKDPKSLVLCGFVGVAFVMAWVGVTV